ncbi:PRC-barrel domain-containing protein [Candidatus Saccharibacteria bacterium]|nr:PRC-barrel domain-containing protein [Candidatus Saccharibacteria bacterium]
MLITASKFIGTPILSMQASGRIGAITDFIIEPESLKAIAFFTAGPGINKESNILDAKSIREYSNYGCVVDSADELVAYGDVIRIDKVLDLRFNLIGIKVVTKKGTKLGRVEDFTMTEDNYTIQQLIIKRPSIKSFLDSELTIPRSEIVEITDDKIIVKDEEKTIRARAEKEDFIPNFVNPFRKGEFSPSPAQTENPAE